MKTKNALVGLIALIVLAILTLFTVAVASLQSRVSNLEAMERASIRAQRIMPVAVSPSPTATPAATLSPKTRIYVATPTPAKVK